ncbi:MSHA pilin protein MshD [Halospina denitrificans]|uniref:MSHA pilin protein MshD n=1 Tax=Halospina denitrificans TaxID=332522 RepID=A0A4R7JK38_9GAMM|nr:prepilin-type N-terminal cleavage/methylation domain-containing protein [Halospina denitrificans]TDT36989.1 MSHA pilin protein MshD [Halospina denitrificans]
MSGRRSQAGVTLVELVITIVIIGVALAGVLGGYSLVVGRSANTLFQTRTTAVGQAYLDEILVRRFAQQTGAGGSPRYDGPCEVNPSGGDRENYKVVDDYDVIDDEPPALISGDFESGYDGYRVSVDVTCAGSEVGVGEDAKRIDVSVSPPQGPDMVFTAYKGNF